MGLKLHISMIFLFLFLAFTVKAQSNGVFDVTKFGAKADGKSDDSQALLAAFKEACASTSPSQILIPKGTYSLGQVTLKGPCKAPLDVQLQGTLQAPQDEKAFQGVDSWVTFESIDHFTMSGGGTFDGQGTAAWATNDCHKNTNCAKLPVSIRLNFITNGMIQDVTSLNSKNFHVNVLGCKNLTFYRFTITAPENSINTDGIHLGRSNGINITESTIATGDDCISIGDGTQQLTVHKVTCGPGHGISVGSLGKYKNEEPVVGITVTNCTLKRTMFGVRIKTWPASPMDSVASDMHFEDIIMEDVTNPVLIDQEYCPYNQCTKQSPSRVKISNVSLKNIRGTSGGPMAVKLACSPGIPCENVELGDIDLAYNGKEGPVKFVCSNITPKTSGKQNPPACTSTA